MSAGNSSRGATMLICPRPEPFFAHSCVTLVCNTPCARVRAVRLLSTRPITGLNPGKERCGHTLQLQVGAVVCTLAGQYGGLRQTSKLGLHGVSLACSMLMNEHEMNSNAFVEDLDRRQLRHTVVESRAKLRNSRARSARCELLN